jgi:hypothetical protein
MQRDEAARKARTSSGASEALERLRSGDITLDAYLDFRADEGVKEIAALFPAEQVRRIREVLREQLATDPTLLATLARLTSPEAGRGG